MLVGDKLWDHKLSEDIDSIELYGRTVRTYMPSPSCLYETLAETAQRLPNKTAIFCEDSNSFTFGAVKDFVDSFAYMLHSLYGIARGSRVGVLLENGIDFITSFYAVNRLGAILVPLPGKFRRAEVDALVSRADLDLVICQEEQADWFPHHTKITTLSQSCAYGLPTTSPAKPSGVSSVFSPSAFMSGLGLKKATDPLADVPLPTWEDDAILMFTSGTTSISKGVLLTNMNAVHAIRSYERVLGLTEDDSTIIAVPIYHVTGMIAIIALFIYLGGAIHVQKRMSGRPFLREIRKSGISFIHASPTVFALMLEEEERFLELPSVRMMACGAAHMPVSRIRELHRWMPQMEFRTIYGLTESCSPGFVFPADAAQSDHIGSSGLPIPGLDVKICDDDGNELDANQIGEIWIHGANVARRYDKIETPALTSDGWLGTGDIGKYTEYGYVYILDRKKDLINRGGEKIWCIDVEEELRRLSEIEDASLVGVPDEIYGEVGGAAIVLAPGAEFTEPQVRSQLNKRLARFQIPQYFKVVDALPLTPGSKIDKNAVRRLFD